MREEWTLVRIANVFRSQGGIVRSDECQGSHSIKKRVAKKNEQNLDNNTLYINAKPRITTGGVENIPILEYILFFEAGHTSALILDDLELSVLDDWPNLKCKFISSICRAG